MKRRKTEQDYHDLAKKRGLAWISSGHFPEKASRKTWWECQIGHRWETTYNAIQQGKGCPFCARVARRKSINDYHLLAKRRGFVWISDGGLPKSVGQKTWWACSSGHKWEARYGAIRQGTRCPFCARIKKTKNDYDILAEKRGFKWISSGGLPKKVAYKTWWECPKGHRWEASYNSIQQGRVCTVCTGVINGCPVSSQQREIAQMIDGELNFPFGRRRIDIALTEQKIAIEYDSWYWHGNRKEEDDKRIRELINHGWSVISIKSNRQIPSKNQLDSCLDMICNASLVELTLDDWGKGSLYKNNT